MSVAANMAGSAPVFAQTMLRVKDPKKTREFYETKLGMKFLTHADFPDLKFSLYLYAYTDEDVVDPSLPQEERTKWLFGKSYPTIEITHNWGKRI